MTVSFSNLTLLPLILSKLLVVTWSSVAKKRIYIMQCVTDIFVCLKFFPVCCDVDVWNKVVPAAEAFWCLAKTDKFYWCSLCRPTGSSPRQWVVKEWWMKWFHHLDMDNVVHACHLQNLTIFTMSSLETTKNNLYTKVFLVWSQICWTAKS